MFISFSQNNAYRPSFNRNIRFSLSKNELQELIKQGLSPKEISQKYNVSLNSCYYHMTKLGLKQDKFVREEKIAEEAKKQLDSGMKIKDIAQKFNRSTDWTRKLLSILDIKLKSPDTIREELIQCIESKMTAGEIAEKFNHKTDWVYKTIKKLGLQLPGEFKMEKRKVFSNEITKCLNEGMKDKEICNKFKITPSQLNALKNEFELRIPRLSQDIYWEIIPPRLEASVLTPQISKKLGVTKRTVNLWAKKNLGLFPSELKKERMAELFKQRRKTAEIAKILDNTKEHIKRMRGEYKQNPENFSQGKRQNIINTIKNERKNGTKVEEIAEKLHISPRGVQYYLENF